ncbi:hypothetical protein BGZ47_006458 [Haplosporangium gracile]|nr:hypothetical protein BGZ47_006458 [Haplosporangium gracile]
MEEIADRTEVVLLDDLNPTTLLSLSNMIHSSPNGFESGFIRSAITSSVVTAAVTATNTSAATSTAAASTTTATGSTTATEFSTTTTTTSPTELRLKHRLQRIISIPPSVAQTHSNKATASTSTHTTPSSTTPSITTTSPKTNTTISPTTITPKRGGLSRVEKKHLVGVTAAVGQDKPLVTTTTATVTSRLVGSGTDSSAPLPTPSLAPAAPTPVSNSYPDSYSSEKDLETSKVADQHHLHNSYYYSPDPMPQRQVYTVGSSLLAKAKVKAMVFQHNLLPPQQQQPSTQQQHQLKRHKLDPLTNFELHKENQEDNADGRGSNSDGTDVESNASNSNSNTISVGTANHLKSIHNQHHHHHRSSSAQLDNIIMSDSDPQPDNSHDPSNDSDSTVADHYPHEALLSLPTPRSRRCSTRSRNSIGPDDEKLSSACIAAAAGGGGGVAAALLNMTPAVRPCSLSKETAAGVKQKDEEDNAVVFVEEKSAYTIGEALPLSDSSEPKMLMTTQDSAALYEAIFQRQHLTEDAIAGSLHELRQLILAYGIPEQPTVPKVKSNRPTIRSKCWKLLLEVHHVSAQEYISLVKQGKPQEYSKIRNDTFRTLATDRKFLDVVEEDSLIRVLCAFAWSTQATSIQDTDVSFTYVQGMNVLAAPFLYTMTEMEAFYSYSNFIKNCCPLYVQPTLQGVHCGIKLLEECLCKIDVELYDYLKSKRLSAELYAFPSVLTICACTPPLDQVMQLWDFLLAWGIHLNIICIIAQLYLIRDELMSHASPMKLLRIFPDLDADKVIRETIRMVKLLPDELYDHLVRHPYDPTVAEKIGW